MITVDDCIEAIRSGRRVYGRGAARYGETYYEKAVAEFGCLQSPQRSFEVTTTGEQTMMVTQPVSTHAENEVREHIREWIESDNVTVKIA
jgi:hypothetical protein